MTRNQDKKSLRAEQAAMLLRRDPHLKVRTAMEKCGYTKEEAKNDNLQRCVRKYRTRLRQEKLAEDQEKQASNDVPIATNFPIPPPQDNLPQATTVLTQAVSTSTAGRKRKRKKE